VSDPDEPAHRRLEVFHARDAKPLGPEMMSSAGVTEGLQAQLAKLAAAGVTAGIGERNLVLFSESEPSGMSLVHIWFKSGYVLPAHSHDCDCLYYVLAGELRLGSRLLRASDGLFVPAGRSYAYEAGPEGVEVLEFRNATRFNIALKEGDGSRWQRIAAAFSERAEIWEQETVPPSQRHGSE
jgi:quercetin dioxygenase-like cupin family protein